MLVKMYLYSTIRSIRPAEGIALYVLATEIGGKEATLQGRILFREKPEEKTEREKASDKVSHLICAFEAVSRLTDKCDALEVYMDSSYLCAGWEAGWLDKWRQNGYRDVHGNEIAHKELWQGIDEKLISLGIKPQIHLMEQHPWSKWFEHEGRKITEGWKITGTNSINSTKSTEGHSA